MVAPNAVDTWQTIRIIGTVLRINFMGQIVTAVEIQGIFEQLRFEVHLYDGMVGLYWLFYLNKIEKTSVRITFTQESLRKSSSKDQFPRKFIV